MNRYALLSTAAAVPVLVGVAGSRERVGGRNAEGGVDQDFETGGAARDTSEACTKAQAEPRRR